MSTDTPVTATVDETPMLRERWQLSPAVALRPESFGALAYHFGNRRLTFLKRPQLLTVVRSLADYPDVESALAAADVPASQWPAYARALAGLAGGDMIRRVDTAPADEGACA